MGSAGRKGIQVEVGGVRRWRDRAGKNVLFLLAGELSGSQWISSQRRHSNGSDRNKSKKIH